MSRPRLRFPSRRPRPRPDQAASLRPEQAAGPRQEQPASSRRRRLTAAAGLVVVALATAGVMVAIASGGSSHQPKSAPSGGGDSAARLLTQATQPAAGPEKPAAAAFKPDPQAVKLAGGMALKAQVAQLFLVSVNGSSPSAAAGFASPAWGGVVLDSSNSSPRLGALTRALDAAAKSHKVPPPLIAVAQAGGPGTAFPHLAPAPQPAVAATGQATQARTQALRSARQLRALHINMTLAPLADVDIPTGSLSRQLYSQDPTVVSQFATQAVRGYYDGGLISAVGHFPGEGAASSDPDQSPATVGGSLTQLRAHDMAPFAALASSAPVIVMSNAAYAAFDGVTPASLLRQAVSLLPDSYGFRGVVMSDDLDATLRPTGEGPGAVAVQALQAGDDLLYITGPVNEHAAAYAAVLAAAQKSPAIKALVREALLRDLSLKARYGILG